MNDLTNVIDAAVTDVTSNTEELDNSTDDTLEVSDGLEVSSEPSNDVVDGDEVQSPAVKEQEAKGSEEDDFLSKLGVQSKSFTGRDNPIPYSRVKKIVAKAKAEAKEAAVKEFESKYGTEKLQPLETKVRDYEDRLTKVAQFEQVLEHDPDTFLQYLSQIPAYAPFFQAVRDLYAKSSGGAAEAPADKNTFVDDPSDPMPQPNKPQPDGSRVYDLEGLNQLMAWQSRQVEKRVLAQAEEKITKRYAPIEQEWQRQQYYNQVSPIIDQQVAEARTWDRFPELEEKVVEIMASDKNISLERAYMMAYQKEVVPKLAADRNRVRADVLEEMKKRPVTTSAPVNPMQPKTSQETGQSIEDIILAEMRKLQA